MYYSVPGKQLPIPWLGLCCHSRMNEPRITGLRADIVPHRRWAVSKWFYAHPLWYYHRPGTDEKIVPNRTFYELVDPELRGLVRVLHDADLHTTPSCQGHFYPRERFERIWAQLQGEADAIRNGGLVVKDSETQETYRFAEARYRVPWPDFQAFYAEANEHQGIGYIGALIRPDQADAGRRLAGIAPEGDRVEVAFDETLGRMLGGQLLTITTRPANEGELREMWRAVTQRAREAMTQ